LNKNVFNFSLNLKSKIQRRYCPGVAFDVAKREVSCSIIKT
jgi:hypothetical protein